MTNATRSTGSQRVREALSAQAALAGRSAPPPDAFERRFWQSRRHRDTLTPGSQSRPWLLWFLVIALSGGIGAAVFWSDSSISGDGSRQAVSSDSAWRGVIRHQRPDRAGAVVREPAITSAAAPSTRMGASTNSPNDAATDSPVVKPVQTIVAAYASTVETARGLVEKAGLLNDDSASQASPSADAKPATMRQPQATAIRPQPTADRLGDPTVLSIQGLLSKQGFAPGPADGLIGTRTRTAILAWQLQQGLPTTGQATKSVLEQLLDPAKAQQAADQLPLSALAQQERRVIESWCTTGRNAGNLVAYYECMGAEVANLSNGLRMPVLRTEASGNLDALATARLLCSEQVSASPQTYFKCLHAELNVEKPLFVME